MIRPRHVCEQRARAALLLLLLSLLASPFALAPRAAGAEPEPAPAAYRAGFDSLGEAELRAWVGFLASAALEGRESGTRGYDLAAQYVASILESLGVRPAGDAGTFFQRFVLVRREWDLDGAALTFLSPGGKEESIPLKGEVAVRSGADLDWRLPWVFAGFGEGADADSHDDFGGLLPVEERVVMVLSREGRKRPEETGARLRGARRVVVVSDDRVKEVAQGMSTRLEAEYRHLRSDEELGDLQVLYMTRKLADRILAVCGRSVDGLRAAPSRPPSFPLDGVEIRLGLKRRETRLSTSNVAGILEGSDPALKEEHVTIGAHLDHVGLDGDKVHHGADDNASGSAAVLGVARAFLENGARPRRSLIFLFYGAEEKGLHGSMYFVDHPPVPLERIVLNINLDMVGRNEEVRSDDPGKAERAEDNDRTLHLVGAGRHSLELDPWVRSVNNAVGLEFESDEEDRVFRRSDQYSFARRGVPVVFFFTGFHPDYHKPTDTAEKLNYSKLLGVTRLAFGLAFEVAERPSRLQINRF